MTTKAAQRSNPPKGMRDLLPEEVDLRDWATETIVSTYRSFGFSRIETPCLDSIELLRGGEGGENLQLIFEVLKRGEKLEKAINSEGNEIRTEDLSDLGLRFDLTVPLARYYAANMNDLPTPFKSIQIGPVWRAERPQQGRYRQFTQCDIDIIGIKTSIAELELISATAEALQRLGFSNFTVRINDRRLLQEIALSCGFDRERLDNIFIAIDKLDKIGIDGVKKELDNNKHPQNAVDKLVEKFSPIPAILAAEDISGSERLDRIASALGDLKSEALEELKQLVEAIEGNAENSYKVVFDPTLVRGMGYYTGPIFEVSAPGYSSSIAGGGRYDRMLEKFLGREIPACGFSIGFERVISILQAEKAGSAARAERAALIYDPKRDELKAISAAMKSARKTYANLSLLPKKKDLKKQIDQLGEEGFSSFCVFKGDPEQLEFKELG